MPPGDLRFVPFSWSTEGERLAGHLRHSDSAPGGIAVLDLAGRSFRRLTEFGLFPQWLDDDRRIVFGDRERLYLLDSVDGDVKELASLAPDTFTGQIRLDPDGRGIYLTRQAQDRNLWLRSSE